MFCFPKKSSVEIKPLKIKEPSRVYLLFLVIILRIMDNQSFFTKVYDLVKLIPPGRVTSYGAIARYLGAAKSARLVGYAMNSASKMDDVPAHRVVNRNGLLTGKHHFPGTYVMQQMLEEEGIEVKDDKVLAFNEVFWDPSQEL